MERNDQTVRGVCLGDISVVTKGDEVFLAHHLISASVRRPVGKVDPSSSDRHSPRTHPRRVMDIITRRQVIIQKLSGAYNKPKVLVIYNAIRRWRGGGGGGGPRRGSDRDRRISVRSRRSSNPRLRPPATAENNQRSPD